MKILSGTVSSWPPPKVLCVTITDLPNLKNVSPANTQCVLIQVIIITDHTWKKNDQTIAKWSHHCYLHPTSTSLKCEKYFYCIIYLLTFFGARNNLEIWKSKTGCKWFNGIYYSHSIYNPCVCYFFLVDLPLWCQFNSFCQTSFLLDNHQMQCFLKWVPRGNVFLIKYLIKIPYKKK